MDTLARSIGRREALAALLGLAAVAAVPGLALAERRAEPLRLLTDEVESGFEQTRWRRRRWRRRRRRCWINRRGYRVCRWL
jgi:hypothetical protein